jgi:uncharacterized membrane protein
MLKRIQSWSRQNWVFLGLLLIGFVLYLLISITKHLHFNSTGFDLVIFDQAVRHYSEFSAPASSFRGYSNLLGDHFHPIIILLAPLYWVFNTPMTLLVAQAALIISATLPVYLFTKRRLGKIPSILLAAAFVLSPVLLRAIYFDFHEIAFAIPLIAWAIYLIDLKKYTLMYLPLLLLLFVKEDMSFLVAMFGVYLITQKRYRHAAILIASGIIWFLLATKLFIPFFAAKEGGVFSYWTYGQLGDTPFSAVVDIVTHPLLFLSLLVLPIVKLLTFIKTFVVFLGLTFLSPIIILVIPLILERFLSSNENFWQFNYHYGAVLAPIMAMAAADGLYRIRSIKIIKGNFKKISIAITGVFAVMALVMFILSPMSFILKPSNYPLTPSNVAGYAIIKKVPIDASVCTTNHIAPHLGAHILTPIGFYPTPVKSFACDFILTSSDMDQSPALNETIANAKENGFKTIDSEQGWVLYEKNKG